MHIQSYQIHNVLNVYRRQLSQGKKLGQLPSQSSNTCSDSVTISDEGKRKSVIEKVSANIINKLSKYEPKGEAQANGINDHRKDVGKTVADGYSKDKDFIFNVIDQNNKKVTNSICVDDSSVLINRLEQLAQNAVKKNNKE
jgi:hypothetical protein